MAPIQNMATKTMGMARKGLSPILVASQTVNRPATAIIVPWAKLTIRITPKMRFRLCAISRYMPASSTPFTRSCRISTPSPHGPGPAALG